MYSVFFFFFLFNVNNIYSFCCFYLWIISSQELESSATLTANSYISYLCGLHLFFTVFCSFYLRLCYQNSVNKRLISFSRAVYRSGHLVFFGGTKWQPEILGNLSTRGRQPEENNSRSRPILSPRFLYYLSLKEKRYLVMWILLCEGKF